MSFLKQLLTPFVEFDEATKKSTPQPKVEAGSTKPAGNTSVPNIQPAPNVNQEVHHPLIDEPAPAVASNQVAAYSPSGNLTGPLPEHEKYFEKLIDDANASHPVFQGTDFKEFIDSKFDIDDIHDEALKYRTAFNVLKSTGLTKEKLFSTAQEYLNVIGRDMNTFQGAHAQKYSKEVQHKELQVQKKAEELQVLAQKMNALKSEINALTQDISVTRQSLDTIRNSYLLAGEKKQNEIQSEIKKISQYF